MRIVQKKDATILTRNLGELRLLSQWRLTRGG